MFKSITRVLCATLLLILSLFCCLSCTRKPPVFGELDFSPITPDEYVETDEATTLVKISVVDFGDIIIRLYPEVAPKTVENFQSLVAEKFYDGLIFHRVVEGYVIQTGSPTGNGIGGSSQTIKGEFDSNGFENNLKHIKGTVSMARLSHDMDSASSQFFIVHQTNQNSSKLNGEYASFGYVIHGMDVVNAIAKTPVIEKSIPITPVVVESIRFIKPAN